MYKKKDKDKLEKLINIQLRNECGILNLENSQDQIWTFFWTEYVCIRKKKVNVLPNKTYNYEYKSVHPCIQAMEKTLSI